LFLTANRFLKGKLQITVTFNNRTSEIQQNLSPNSYSVGYKELPLPSQDPSVCSKIKRALGSCNENESPLQNQPRKYNYSRAIGVKPHTMQQACTLLLQGEQESLLERSGRR